MNLIFKVTEEGATPGILKREWSALMSRVWAGAGKLWHSEIRRKHFKNSATREYGYKPRSGEAGSGKAFKGMRRNSAGRLVRFESYTAKKLRKQGHTRPLVLTGQSMRLTEIARISSTGKGGRVSMNSPGFNRRSPGGPDMRAELTAVSRVDLERIVAGMETDIDSEVGKIRTRKTEEIRS